MLLLKSMINCSNALEIIYANCGYFACKLFMFMFVKAIDLSEIDYRP